MKLNQQRLVLFVAILASFVAFLDSAVVNVALPAIQRQFGGGLAAQQWIVDAYLLTLGAFILLAGSLSDLFGQKRILGYGLIGFGLASLVCAVAPDNSVLIASRSLQGLAGALLVPSSLALITARTPKAEFARSVGLWTAWTGIAFVIGPLLGGFLVDSLSWRYIFAINIVPVALCLGLLRQLARDTLEAGPVHIDITGAGLCVLSLLGLVFALIELPSRGLADPIIFTPLLVGSVLMVLFLAYEARAKAPMLPLSLFKGRNFSAGNLATLCIYAGLSAATFIIAIFLQQTISYSALFSGLSLLPITIIMFFFSGRVGSWASRSGPRWFMTFGPLLAAVGFVYLALKVRVPLQYWSDLLPGLILFGFGLVLTVTPLTAAVLSGVPRGHAGIASSVNNAVARVAGLIAIAAIGAVLASQFIAAINYHPQMMISHGAQTYLKQTEAATFAAQAPIRLGDERATVQHILTNASVHTFKIGMFIIAILLAAGGVVSAIGIENPGAPAAAVAPPKPQ